MEKSRDLITKGASTRSFLTKKLAAEMSKGKRARKKARVSLKEMDVELTKLNKELLTFTYLFNHNLQEPLRNLQMTTSLILETEEKRLSEKGKEYFRRLQASVKLIRNLVQDLLAYSNTKASIKYEKTDLNVLLNEVRYELSDSIDLKKAKIISSGLCTLKVIRFQFRTLFRDLLSNSLKFSREGVPPKIIIKSRMGTGAGLKVAGLSKKKKYCHLSFIDNGMGFEPHFAQLIFEIFQRLNGSSYKGTGIGLAITKKIVENHGGIIIASGIKGAGATFDIYIPLKK
jgi:signal transduction histidine kinase